MAIRPKRPLPFLLAVDCPSGTDCQFGWMPYAVGPTTCPSPPLDLGPGCPATHAEGAKRGCCSKDAQVCAYSEGLCACSRGVWACAHPAAGCPPFRPRMGSACSNTNLHCDYGICPGYPRNAVFDCAGKTSNGKVSGFWTEGCSARTLSSITSPCAWARTARCCPGPTCSSRHCRAWRRRLRTAPWPLAR
jgi:hypothetical protein